MEVAFVAWLGGVFGLGPGLALQSIGQTPQAESVASAEDARNVEPWKPLASYRRIFVPADKVEAWPRDGEKFLPIESREFDAWIAAANGAAEQGPSSATIREAEYSARLENGRIVSGRGQWKIDLRGDTPAFLRLSPTSLVLREARWHDSPQRAVRLGTWGRSGRPATEFGLQVAESGTLEFAWNAQPKPTREGVEIPWQLPSATVIRVVLDLPEGKEPRIEGGIVLKSNRASLDVADAMDRWRWELACSSSPDAVLRIVDTDPAATVATPNTSLYDDVVYQLTQRGLDIVATWSLEQLTDDQPRELAMLIPRDVQLVSAVADDKELPWRAVDQEKSDEVQVVFKLPVRPDRRPLQITLRASHPLVLDKPWPLPKLRPEGIFWSSGDIELVIADELEMRGLKPVGCVETGVSDLAGNAERLETWRLAAYSNTAEVVVSIARRQPEAMLRLGSSLAMADPDITGRLVTEWKVAQGKIHNLSGELARGWIIEAVETVPADALSEWFIDRRDGRRQIDIQLSKAASATRDLSVIIRGRLPRSEFNDQLSAKTMRMITWRGARIVQHVLAFETTEPFAAEPIGGLTRIAIDSIGDDRQTLLDADMSLDSVFDMSQAGKDAGLALTTKRGQFAADIRLNASLIGQELRQESHLVVTPTSYRVDRLLIASTGPLGDEVRWTEAVSGVQLSAERLPADDPRRAGLPEGGEQWLVRLPSPTAAPVEIVATTTTHWPERGHLPLLTMPEAVKQRGRVFVRGQFDTSPVLEPLGLTAIPLPVESTEGESSDRPPIRAVYRFDPADCLDSTRAPKLWITPADTRDASSLIARRVALESYFSSNGDASHRVTYFLTNEGGAPFELQLPPNSTLQSIIIDGRVIKQSVARASDTRSSTRLSIPKGSPTVSISFDTRQAPLSVGSKLMPPLVESETPILAGDWNIRLPEELSVSTFQLVSWRQRLFGPLGRSEGARPFQPLRASDWVGIVNSIAGARTGGESSAEQLAGWHTYQTTFAADGPSAVYVSHPSMTNAWTASLFLVCLVVGAWVRRRRSEWFVALLAVASGLAFLLPAVVAPLAAGAVLGLLLSVLVPRPRQRADEIGASTHWHRFSTVGASVVVAICGLTNLAYGQQGDTPRSMEKTSPSRTIHRVLIPVDADGRPVGTKHYVSERFARELLRAAAENSSAQGQWLLRGVAYTGELRERAEPAGVVAGEWTIACDVEVLARDTTIVLPLVRDEATWPAIAMVDGVPLPIAWRDDGRACTVKIAEPGRYSLVISAVPRTTVAQGRNVVALSVPPQLGASFRLNHPAESTDLTVSGASPNSANSGSNVFECELDGSGRLEFQWPASDSVSSDGHGRRTTQLEWLQLGVDRVELVTKYIFEGSASQAEEVVVEFDPAWELLQDEPSSFDREVTNESANRKSVRIKLPINDADRQELVLRWRLSHGRSLGRLLLPSIELMSHPVTQRWRGVSSAASIECEVADVTAPSGTATEFLAIWGDAEGADAPQIVLGNIQPTDRWSVTAKPRQTESEIAEVLHIAAKHRQLSVVYQANVKPGSAHSCQFPLMAPADVSVDEITLTQDDRRVPIRWARLADDLVNVFLSEEMTDDYQVVLRGSMRVDGDGATALPRVSAADSNGVTTVQFYRDEDAVLSLSGLPAVDETLDAPLDSPPISWAARHVAGYRLDKTLAANVRLEVQPNQVELVGNSLTTLTRTSDGWVASFQSDFSVAQGTLDTLRLRVPPTWSGTPTLNSSVPASIAVAADEQGLTLSVRFAEPIPAATAVKVRIETPIAFASAAVSVPQIDSTPPIRGSRYVQVPSLLEGQPVGWNMAAVRKAELPLNLRPTSNVVTGTSSFEIEASPFQVTLQPPVRTQHAARVRLADTVISSDQRGAQLMTTRFVVESQGLPECTLRLPENQQLVAVRLAGRPALMQRMSGEDWRVALGPPKLPSTLEVVSRSIEPTTDRRLSEVRRPALLAGQEPIPVEINLWSFGYPSASRRPLIGVTAEATAGEQAVHRFDRLLSIAESATPAAVESPAPDGDNWFRPWAAWLTRLRSEALETITKSDSRQRASQVSRPLEEQLATSSARLDAWIEQCTENLVGPESGALLAESRDGDLMNFLDETASSQRWVYCVTDGRLDRLTVEYASSAASPGQVQVVELLAILSLSIAAILAMRRPAAWDLLYQWPHTVGFLIGIAYWAWMQPSWCGLLIATMSLVLACRSGWPGRAIRMEASTVMRASRPK